MTIRLENESDSTYSLGAVVRLTGLSAHTLRAWERRYDAVRPARTEGGTRRYREAEVARLRLLRAGVEAGHRISDLASLSDAAIEERLAAIPRATERPLEAIYRAMEEFDVRELDRLLAMQFSVLGPTAFARQIASPLLNEVGDRWERGELSVAAEHLVSAVTRSILSIALRGGSRSAGTPRMLFATPSGEPHEFGLLIAAVAAVGKGAEVTYLGAELPAADLARAAERVEPAVVAISVVQLAPDAARDYLVDLRRAVPAGVEIWAGGAGAPQDAVPGVQRIENLDDLESRVERLLRLSALS